MSGIETFTKAEFEAALPVDLKTKQPLWEPLGTHMGEYVYAVAVVGTNKRVVVRSSVSAATDVSGGLGEDSIRLWVEYTYKGKWYPLAKDDTRWTTRQAGWPDRMRGKIRDLYELGLADSQKWRDKQAANGTPNCPDCGQPMKLRHRRSDGHPFWGCRRFPKCRGSRNYEEPKADVNKGFIPTEQQLAIFERVKRMDHNLVVRALAGTGKTTTIVAALKYVHKGLTVAFLAFNSKIAKELGRRAPPGVYASTLHSLGWGNIKGTYPNAEFDEYKIRVKLQSLMDAAQTDTERNKIKMFRGTIQSLIGLCKAHLVQPTLDNIDWIADRHDIELNGDAEWVQAITQLVYDWSIETIPQVYDYNDMIHASATGLVQCRKFDAIFGDEAQDWNKAQIQMVLNSMSEGGHVVAVGDENQSMYGFLGADTEAIDNIIEALDAEVLPLTKTWRCPKSHVRLAQEIVPEFECPDSAIEGVEETIRTYEFLDRVQDGDAVLCRCNAPLIKPALGLLRQGRKVVVLGRNIGENLIQLMDRVAEKFGVDNLLDLMDAMRKYVDEERAKLIAAEKPMQAQMLEDKRDTVIALSEGMDTVVAVKERIYDIFSNECDGVVFSSVHKAKGLEWERTFILKPELMPLSKATKDWEMEQEWHIKYVALTRSKREMYFVTGKDAA